MRRPAGLGFLMLRIHQFPCLADNYGFLVHDEDSGETACIDTPDAERYLAEAKAQGWRITQIWNTHWHADHAGGNAAIKAATGASVAGPEEIARAGDRPDRVAKEGDVLSLGAARARVLDVGGHTLGHVAYVFDEAGCAFVGDSLFALGCGRMFEGHAQQFWASLAKLAALPATVKLYCAHEYTQSNARFALSVDGDNVRLRARASLIDRQRAAGEATVPSTVEEELATNPFLRAPLLKASLGLGAAEDWEAFARLRAMKDGFR